MEDSNHQSTKWKRQIKYRATPKGKEYMARDNRKRVTSKYLWSLRQKIQRDERLMVQLTERLRILDEVIADAEENRR